MIKIYSALIMVIALPVLGKAQFTQGQKVLGGNVGFSINNQNNNYNPDTKYKSTSINFSPTLGSFIKPNLLQGGGLLLGYYKQRNENTTNQFSESKVYNIGLTAFRQKFIPLSSSFFFTLRGNVSGSYSFGKETSTSGSIVSIADIRGYNGFIDFSPGITYKISDRFLFDANLNSLIGISYSHSKRENKVPNAPVITNTSDVFSIYSALGNSSNLGNIGFGFRYLLRK